MSDFQFHQKRVGVVNFSYIAMRVYFITLMYKPICVQKVYRRTMILSRVVKTNDVISFVSSRERWNY